MTAPADLAIGSFSDDPPWLVDPPAMTWRRAVPTARWVVRAALPELTRPRRLPDGTRAIRVARHLGLAVAWWAVGARRQGGSASKADISRRLRIAAEHLGPTYIKLGQIISSGDGLFPEELVTEFKKCRDQVPPESWAAVREVVESELGRPLEEVFSQFDRAPLAAASIAQVHAATLVTGERVVVKVQRPSVATLVHADLKVMAWLAPFLVGRIPIAALANPPALVELFAETITEELDFRLEAENMLDIAHSFHLLGQRGYVIPRPHPDLVTPRMLVMERLDGFAFDDVVGMQAAGVDTEAVVRIGMIGFMEGAMIHGIFHGDLHGGNLFVMADGRVALLDFGITGRMDEPKRRAFLRLLITATMNDVEGQLAALRDLGALPADTDLGAVIRDLGLDKPPIDPTQLTADEMVGEIQRVVKALLGYGARLPKELMLFVKNMVFLDGAIATLAPDLDLFAEIANISTYFAEAHGEQIAEEIGMPLTSYEMDLTGVKGSFGVDPSTTEKLTYRQLQERRALIRSRFQNREVS
jgi:ubiquinone biosynthesis protein